MIGKTAGESARATYEALGVERDQRWELTAQAAIDWWFASRDLDPPQTSQAEPKPAPELAAAMAESAEIRKVVREFIGMFHGISGGYGARTSIGRLNRLAKAAGVEPPRQGDPLSAVVAAELDQLDQLREQLATVLGEFKLSGDGCHARVSQVTLAKRKQAAGMGITDAERKMIGG